MRALSVPARDQSAPVHLVQIPKSQCPGVFTTQRHYLALTLFFQKNYREIVFTTQHHYEALTFVFLKKFFF